VQLDVVRRGTSHVVLLIEEAEPVCVLLPRLGRREAGLVHAAWQAGPPREEVGLEPFPPPEYLNGYGAQT
jgi:hypothetical protein